MVLAERIWQMKSNLDSKASLNDYFKKREMVRRLSKFPYALSTPQQQARQKQSTPDRLEGWADLIKLQNSAQEKLFNQVCEDMKNMHIGKRM